METLQLELVQAVAVESAQENDQGRDVKRQLMLEDCIVRAKVFCLSSPIPIH